MKDAAKHLARQGRYGDTELLHVSKQELAALRGIGSLTGRKVTTNPTTGLPEAFNFTSLIPTIVGLGGTLLTGGAMSPLMAGMLSGAATTAATGGDWRRGLMSGLSGAAIGNLGQGFVGMGTEGAAAAAGAGAEAAGMGAAGAGMGGAGQGMLGMGLDGAAGDMAATYATGGLGAAGGGAGMGAAEGMLGMGLDGAAGDMAATYATQGGMGLGMGLDGAAGDLASTYATGGQGMMGMGLDGAAGDFASTYATQGAAPMGMGLDGAAGDMASTYAVDGGMASSGAAGMGGTPSSAIGSAGPEFSMGTMAQNAQNPSSWGEQFMGDKLLTRTAPGLLALSSSVGGAMAPSPEDIADGFSSEKDKAASEFAQKEKRMERDYYAPTDAMYAMHGGEPLMFSAPRYNFAEGGIVSLPAGKQDSGTLKAVRALRSRYRSKAQAVEDMKVPNSFIQRLGIRDPNDPIMQYAFGYTKEQGKKKPSERISTPQDRMKSNYASGGPIFGFGDGLSDAVPAMINGKLPAQLSDGEYVVPADVVSGLGNGSTNAGVKQLNDMMGRVREARTGKRGQARPIKPNRYIPK